MNTTYIVCPQCLDRHIKVGEERRIQAWTTCPAPTCPRDIDVSLVIENSSMLLVETPGPDSRRVTVYVPSEGARTAVMGLVTVFDGLSDDEAEELELGPDDVSGALSAGLALQTAWAK